MSNLTRYDHESDPYGLCDMCGSKMVESVDGDYVKFDDIKELLNSSHNKQSTPFTCDGCVVESCDMRGKAIKCNGKVV